MELWFRSNARAYQMVFPELITGAEREIEKLERSQAALNDHAPDPNELKEGIESGLRWFTWIIEADESFRDQLARGTPYSPVIDAVLFGMLTNFVRHTEDFIRQLQNSRQDDLTASIKSLKDSLSRARAILEPPPDIQKLPGWKQLIGRASRWPGRVAGSSPPVAAFNSARRHWNGVPVSSIMRALRRHNLTSRGLDEDEITELSDIGKFPGTLLGELQERYWHSQTAGAANSVHRPS